MPENRKKSNNKNDSKRIKNNTTKIVRKNSSSRISRKPSSICKTNGVGNASYGKGTSIMIGSMISITIIVGAWAIYMRYYYWKPSKPKVIIKDIQRDAEKLYKDGISFYRQGKYQNAVDCFEKSREKLMQIRELCVKKKGTLPYGYGYIDDDIRKINMALKEAREALLRSEQEKSRYR